MAHRSIQDIIPPTRSRPLRPPVSGPIEPPPREPPQEPPRREPPINPKRPSGFGSFATVIAAIILLIGIAVAVISTIFYRAYVTVTPYTFTANVNATFQAATSSDTLPYQKVTATDTVTKTVATSGSQHVENHASGTITIYNSYSASCQRLITNTRFSTSNGLIFRIHDAVVIPGYTTSGGTKVPGTVQAVVYADQAGDSYNVGPSTFNIPGLQGTPQYSGVYAKSTAAMAGGFIGDQAVVDPSLRQQTEDALKAELDRSLRSKLSAEAPQGTLVFSDTVVTAYTDNPDTVNGNNATISVSGTATAPAVSDAGIARSMASSAQVTYTGPLTVSNPNDIHVTVTDPADVGNSAPIQLAVSGSADLVGSFDQNQLEKDLAGKNEKDIKDVLPSYPAISNIDVKIYPFWRTGIPSDTKKIEIKEATPAGSGNTGTAN